MPVYRSHSAYPPAVPHNNFVYFLPPQVFLSPRPAVWKEPLPLPFHRSRRNLFNRYQLHGFTDGFRTLCALRLFFHYIFSVPTRTSAGCDTWRIFPLSSPPSVPDPEYEFAAARFRPRPELKATRLRQPSHTTLVCVRSLNCCILLFVLFLLSVRISGSICRVPRLGSSIVTSGIRISCSSLA